MEVFALSRFRTVPKDLKLIYNWQVCIVGADFLIEFLFNIDSYLIHGAVLLDELIESVAVLDPPNESRIDREGDD